MSLYSLSSIMAKFDTRARMTLRRLDLLRVFDYARGVSVYRDIKYLVPHYEILNFVDIGAHTGESALQFLKYFPKATCFCFEPTKKSFEKLQRNTSHLNNVRLFNDALSNAEGVQPFLASHNSRTNQLIRENVVPKEEHSIDTVPTITLDKFAANIEIKDFDYVKIDTEGHDLNVLQGASTLLRANAINFVEAEVGLNPTNLTHVPFSQIKIFLESFEYRLFGIYEQIGENWRREPYLRRANAVFISTKFAKCCSIGKYGRLNMTVDKVHLPGLPKL